jgi:hypothetical protein
MRIVDLTPEYEDLYCCCLEDWSEEAHEAGKHKACWYAKMKERGLRVKLAQDDKGVVGGMIQYIPVEYSSVEGRDMYYLLCIWVHGYRKGRGNFQKKGMGKALLKAAEADVMNLGAKALIAWGIALPFFMRASWFRKQGYKTVDKSGMIRLLWKPFSPDAIPPRFIKPKRTPELAPGKVNVSVFLNGWCLAQNMVYDRIKKIIVDYLDKVEFNVYHTVEPEIQQYWGITDALYIDGKEIWTGPPPSEKKLRRLIERRIRKLKEPVLA